MICNYREKKPNEKWCESFPIVYHDEEGRDYCVFHAPQGKKGLTLDEFNETVFNFIGEAQRKKKACFLGGVVFEGDINFCRFNKDNPLPALHLQEGVFPGEVNFNNVSCEDSLMFIGTIFQGESHFSNTVIKGVGFFAAVTFEKDAFFTNTEFRGPTEFTGTKFSSRANFLIAKFNSNAAFRGCVFEYNARFESATFAGSIAFQESLFQYRADFENSKFKRVALFEKNEFKKEFYLKNAEFYDKTTFLNTIFKEKADFSNVLFSQNSFIRGETFHAIAILTNLFIYERLTFDGVSLRKTSFLDSDLRKMDFYNCEWHEQKGWKLLYDEVLTVTEVPSASKQLIGKIEILYRQLKQKCKDDSNEIEASNWHYREKEMQRKGSISLFIKTFLSIYYAASGYGENPRLALLVLIFLILFLTFMLSICGLIPVNSASQLCNVSGIQWPQNTDFQKIIFVLNDVFKYATYQKDACLQPTSSMGQIVKIFIQILIPIQGALFALALKNKFRR